MSYKNSIIQSPLMGEIWPSVKPSIHTEHLGHATITPNGPFVVRRFQTLTLTYTLGKFGLDDTGGLRVVQRFINDGGAWQTNNPQGMNYVTATASNGANLKLIVEDSYIRPWGRSLRINVNRGLMQQGDTITVIFGDTTNGGAGMRMPTFCETAHEYRVIVDVCATGQYTPINDRPAIEIVPDKPHKWQAILPTLRHVGRVFNMGIRGDDIWGNPSDKIDQKLFLSATGPVKNVPESVHFSKGTRCLHINNLTTTGEGVIRISVSDADGNILVHSNPLVVTNDSMESFWGDLHGQSGETVGVNTIDEYFDFGKNLAMLDIMCHQANDFQITPEFWQKINTVAHNLNKDDAFVVFPGYEWSGNSPTGGDHNVIYYNEGSPLYRSSRALIATHDDAHNDANTSADLFDKLQSENCIAFGHVGGRPANIAQADGGHIRTAVEIHSDWGTFEWIMADNFALGYRHGVVANSDGHKGRPGASHPGASLFGAFGGLTCVQAPRLTRADIFESYRRRHHYATTGSRLYLDVKTHFNSPVKIFDRNPNYGDTTHTTATIANMGDIVQSADNMATVQVQTHTQSPIVWLDFLNAMNVIKTVRPYEITDLGNRIRITFHGAEYKGRGRQTTWAGTVRVNNAHIEKFIPINMWNNDYTIQQTAENTILYAFLTTGNFLGFDIWLNTLANSSIVIKNDYVNETFAIDNMGILSTTFAAGDLDKKVVCTRLPDALHTYDLNADCHVNINDTGDTPLWVRLNTEDGHTAWSSPTYIFKQE